MKTPSTFLAVALAGALGLSAAQPAKADTTSTMDTIIGAAAVIAGIAISQNVAHKQSQANTVVGTTPWGATVYGDGHVVLPNGQSYYPGNVGQQIACNGTTCTITQNGVAVGYGGYGPAYVQNGYYNGAYYAPSTNTGYYAPYATHRVRVVNNGTYAATNGTYVANTGRYYAQAATTRYTTRVARDDKRTRGDRDDGRALRAGDRN